MQTPPVRKVTQEVGRFKQGEAHGQPPSKLRLQHGVCISTDSRIYHPTAWPRITANTVIAPKPRAENLHLFPALANAPVSLFTGRGRLPTSEEAQSVIAHLRSDHDSFVKGLALTIKAMREMTGLEPVPREEISELRQRVAIIRERLEAPNRLEEKRAYTWPTLLFDEQELAALRARIAHELENLPPRFART